MFFSRQFWLVSYVSCMYLVCHMYLGILEKHSDWKQAVHWYLPKINFSSTIHWETNCITCYLPSCCVISKYKTGEKPKHCQILRCAESEQNISESVHFLTWQRYLVETFYYRKPPFIPALCLVITDLTIVCGFYFGICPVQYQINLRCLCFTY